MLCLTFPLTLALQEIVYRLVDLPGNALGRRWARRLGEPPVIEVRRD